MTALPHHVICGYDGSRVAAAAARWAADEAHRRRCGLTVLGCYTIPVVTDFGMSLGALIATDVEAQRQHTENRLASVAEELRDRHPDLAVNTVALHGSARHMLAEQAENADLLVIGATGAGEVASVLLGSVALAVSRTAPCPVVIVPREHTMAEHPRVVVGIDTLETSRIALDWAIDEADLIGAELAVVHTWSYPYGADTPAATARDIVQVDAARELERAVDHARLRGGGKVDGKLSDGDPADEIVANAAQADLVVVGSRGRGGIRAMFLGSVSNAVIAHAPCPTVVVRQRTDQRGT